MGCGTVLAINGVENLGLTVLAVVTLPAFVGICGADVERFKELPGVKTLLARLRTIPRIPTEGVSGVVTVDWAKSLVGVGILDVDATDGVITVKACPAAGIEEISGCVAVRIAEVRNFELVSDTFDV